MVRAGIIVCLGVLLSFACWGQPQLFQNRYLELFFEPDGYRVMDTFVSKDEVEKLTTTLAQFECREILLRNVRMRDIRPLAMQLKQSNLNFYFVTRHHEIKQIQFY